MLDKNIMHPQRPNELTNFYTKTKDDAYMKENLEKKTKGKKRKP